MVRVLFAWRICSRVLVGLSYVNRLFLAFLNNWTLDQQRFGGATVPWLACRFGCGFRASNRSPVENLFRRRSLRDYFLLERLSRSETSRIVSWGNAHPTVHLRIFAINIACHLGLVMTRRRPCRALANSLCWPRPQAVCYMHGGSVVQGVGGCCECKTA